MSEGIDVTEMAPEQAIQVTRLISEKNLEIGSLTAKLERVKKKLHKIRNDICCPLTDATELSILTIIEHAIEDIEND